ncbi:hypothetical protein [Xanthocytophaga flava]|nr:hypothetical protein [Xanthocytophaga flavus]
MKSEFTSMLIEFDLLYQQVVPLRYARLSSGIDRVIIESTLKSFGILAIPEDFFALYGWKNGFETMLEWWKDEYGEGYYEMIPLDDCYHWMNMANIEMTLEIWHEHIKNAKRTNQLCYWKHGFIPFLQMQSSGLMVIDTIGYWNGIPGQIAAFDYKCSGGYQVVHQDLSKWLETQLELLKNGIFFSPDTLLEMEESIAIIAEINDSYTSRFPISIPLDAI